MKDRFKMDERYKILLSKYYCDEELFELLDLVAIEENRLKELNYLNKGSYPSRRDLLGKLKYDLVTVEKALSKR